MAASSLPTLAFSYVRFSTAEQMKGDSLRRQTELAEAYCRKKGWKLDAALSLRDLGVSAFRGKNALVGNLGIFLAAVKRGTVAPGSALIVESVDRISRQGIDEGYDIIKSILKAGILLVTLSPEREFGPEAVKSLSRGALELQLILERAAEESERKSVRVGAAWRQKKQRGRETGEVITRQLPAWVEERGGKLRLVPARAAVVRRIFQLAAGGYGLSSIVKRLTDERVAPFGKADKWGRSYIGHILKDRRAVGEFQPRNYLDRSADGEPIPNYFPAAVTEAEWHAARAGAAQRRHRQGRISKEVNLFSCMLKRAGDGDTVCVTTQSGTRAGRPTSLRVLRNNSSMEGRERSCTFPLEAFEAAVLKMLREIDPHEILNGDEEPDESFVLAGQLADVEASLKAIEADLDEHGDSPALFRRLRAKEEQKQDLSARLIEAQQKAARPLSAAWGEAKTLLAALADAPDQADARLRLRSALRRIVDSIWVLIVPRSRPEARRRPQRGAAAKAPPRWRDRLCAVQVWFAGGERHRDYLIYYRPAGANGAGYMPAVWRASSLAKLAAPDDLDLRRREDAEALARLLESLALEKLLERLGAGC
jgi:DNA invertase Pin-like site-specific DNA recombinase